MFRRFGTFCFTSIGRVFEDGTECSETSAHKIQTPGNYPRERIHVEQSVPKRRCIKCRRRGITQKEEYNIQNKANFAIKYGRSLDDFSTDVYVKSRENSRKGGHVARRSRQA